MQEDSQHTSDVGRHRRQESRTLAAADLQVVGVDMDEVVLHSLYIFQVDQIALVAAGEMVLRQLLFGAGKAGTDGKLTLGGVIPEQPVMGLEIVDVAGGEHLHPASGQL